MSSKGGSTLTIRLSISGLMYLENPLRILGCGFSCDWDGGVTHHISDKERLIIYVRDQEDHHKTRTFKEEYMELLAGHGIEFDEKYLF